MDTTADRKM